MTVRDLMREDLARLVERGRENSPLAWQLRDELSNDWADTPSEEPACKWVVMPGGRKR